VRGRGEERGKGGEIDEKRARWGEWGREREGDTGNERWRVI